MQSAKPLTSFSKILTISLQINDDDSIHYSKLFKVLILWIFNMEWPHPY